jgi:hypothetical protein
VDQHRGLQQIQGWHLRDGPNLPCALCDYLGGPQGCDFIDAAEFNQYHVPLQAVVVLQYTAAAQTYNQVLDYSSYDPAENLVVYGYLTNGAGAVETYAACPPGYLVAQNSCYSFIEGGFATGPQAMQQFGNSAACLYTDVNPDQSRTYYQFVTCTRAGTIPAGRAVDSKRYTLGLKP